MASKYLSFLDILPAVLWFLIIAITALIIRGNHKDQPEYKFYMPNLFAKLFFGLAFGLFYIFFYGGGDTTAYFDGAIALNNLFFKSPELYFEQMISAPNQFQFTTYYDSVTGYPPGWIYREDEAFFVSKIISVLSFFTLKSYFAMTLIIATFTAHASWKLYQLVKSYEINHEKLLIFGVLFLPSVNFWCSGVSKDSIVFICTLYLITSAFKLVTKENSKQLINIIVIVFSSFLIYHIRSFVLVAILIPLFFGFSSKFIRFIGGGNMAVIAFRTFILLIGAIGIGGSFIVQSEENFMLNNSAVQQAAIIQQDFTQNETYGDKKYDLGDVEFTSIGLLKILPLAVVTGIFRPFIWEALSPTLIMNGLESVVFLYFVLLFIRKDVMKKISFIRTHEFLVFALVFVLIIGFMTGLTSILYGVLVRLRAPLLPFLFILLTIKIPTDKLEETEEENV